MKIKWYMIFWLLLSSCSDVYLSNNEIKRDDFFINYENIFDNDNSYFCYFYLEDCGSCESIMPKINEYASTHLDFYIVIPNHKFNYGYDRNSNIGVNSVENIVLTGFPSLFYFENNEVKEVFVGIREISNELKF